MKELLPYMLMAVAGSVLHIIKKLAQLEKNEVAINFKNWFKKNKYRSILGLGLSIGGVFGLEETQQLTYIACLLVGYTGNSIMNKQ